ncbi:hypothetical protein, partial [Pseudomonas asplenii]|uniref:hypothetical protein n=1 Tax=Pseudomonas asplenii TaxID=53407 RepID=UPI00235FD864
RSEGTLAQRGPMEGQAFFGYFFWRLKKSNSPVRGETVTSVKRANGYVHPVTITPPQKAQKRETKKRATEVAQNALRARSLKRPKVSSSYVSLSR